jgi:hypothetical protein
MDNTPFSPTSTESSTLTRSPQKVTPAMRDDIKTSPRVFTMPQWSTKESPRAGSNDGHSGMSGSPHSSRGGREDAGNWQSMRGEGIQIPAGGKKIGGSLHSRTRSSPQASPNNLRKTDSPHRPPRPDSPSRLLKSSAPLPPPVPRPSETTANGAPIFNKVDFSFGNGQPLDLGIKLDPVYSTYKASQTIPDVVRGRLRHSLRRSSQGQRCSASRTRSFLPQGQLGGAQPRPHPAWQYGDELLRPVESPRSRVVE